MEDMREPMAFEEEQWVCEVQKEHKFLRRLLKWLQSL